MNKFDVGVVELADTAGLRSASSNGVRVQVSPPIPKLSKMCVICGTGINRKSKRWCKKCDPHTNIEKSSLNIKFNPLTNNLHNAAEYELMRVCALCKFEFAIPSHDAPYDLLVDFGSGFKKIQVKSSYGKGTGTNYVFSLNKTRNNTSTSRTVSYKANEVDYFFLYDCDGNKWLIPFNLICKLSSITPIIKYPGYKLNI